MQKSSKSLKISMVCLFIAAVVFYSTVAFGFKVREELNDIERLEFSAEQLYISSSQIQLEDIVYQLNNKDAWNNFVAQQASIYVYIDPRSGRPDSLLYPLPFIPGDGENNTVSLGTLTVQLGYPVDAVTPEVLKDLLIQHIRKHNALLNINMNELGKYIGQQTTDNTWHANFKRQVNGIPVREANISFTINHGNLVLWGLEKWGDINLNTTPTISEETALDIGFRYVGGRLPIDSLTVMPRLEIIMIAPQWDSAVGKGYDHALVWTYNFQREGYVNNWEMIIDAHSGKILSMLDTNQYVLKKIVGAIYPVSCDECCPEGCAQPDTPAIHMNTGFAAPNNYTNYGGLYDYTSGTAVTTLDSRYVRIGTDSCGTVNETGPTGDIDLGGTNGQHNCTVPTGHSAGDTFSSRSCAIETTYMNRQVRSWLNMTWLDSYITCNVNINSTCNAYFSGNTINFYRSGGGCRNTGEIAAVFDHEWGHAVDTHDAQPSISQPGEAIADIAAAVRLHQACIGRGFFWTLNRGCGQWTNCPTNPGTSYGYNCSGYNSAECCLNCTGIRQIDYAQHADPDADTPANYTCSICGSGSGTPCGRETHCEGIPPAEVGWDLAARDLQAAPFNMDKQTAFTIADKIIWQGHNNVTSWYSCTCPSTSSGCGTNNAYRQWITVEDDDGNINNGTPHMTAIYAAFNRHGIACSTPTPQNSGCSSGPSSAPTLTGTPGDNSVALSWNSVSGAANYYVWRSEGSCDFGRVKLTTVSTTSYTDTQALNGNTYYYNVQGVGSNTDCIGPMSNCVTVTPSAPSCTAPTFGGVQSVSDPSGCNAGIQINWNTPSSWGTGATSGTFDVRRHTISACGGSYTNVATGLSATTTTFTDTTATPGTTYYYRVVAINNCTPPMSTYGTNACSSGISDTVGSNPSGLTNNAAADVDPCADTGVQITWAADPSDWGDGGTGTRTYTVRRGTTTIASNIPYGTTSYTDLTGTNGTTYTYTVRYVNGCGLNATTSPGATAADNVGSAPSGLTNNAAADVDPCADTGVQITWAADPSDWGDGGIGTRTYTVRRGTTTIASNIPYGTTSYTDLTGTNGTTYTYTVRYVNGCGLNSTTSPGATAADNVGTAPSGLTNNTAADVSACADTGVQITWAQDPSDWGDGGIGTRTYTVRRGTTTIASNIPYGTTSYTDLTGTNGTTYTYTVRYVNGCGLNSTTSPGATAADNVGAIPSGIPACVCTDTDPCSDTGVQCTWAVDPADWGDGGTGTRTYDVQRDATPIATGLAYGTSSYNDNTGVNGVNYTYGIRYNNGCALSDTVICGIAADDVDAVPCAAVGNNLLVSKSGVGPLVDLAWTAVTCADLSNYRVYGSTSYSATFPDGWTLLGSPTGVTFQDPLTSNYIAYKIITEDICGNISN